MSPLAIVGRLVGYASLALGLVGAVAAAAALIQHQLAYAKSIGASAIVLTALGVYALFRWGHHTGLTRPLGKPTLAVYLVFAVWIGVAIVTLAGAAAALTRGGASENWFGVIGGSLGLIGGVVVIAGFVKTSLANRRGHR